MGIKQERLRCSKIIEMKTFFVSYKEAISYKKASKKSIRRRIKVRLKGGEIYCDLTRELKAFFKCHDRRAFKRLVRVFMMFCLGQKFVGRIDRRLHISGESPELLIECSDLDMVPVLYHLVPADRLELVLKDGLVPGKFYEYVYMTDDVDYIANGGYLHTKTAAIGHDVTYVVLEIAASRLSKKYKISRTVEEHEYVVRRVPTDCFIVPQKGLPQ